MTGSSGLALFSDRLILSALVVYVCALTAACAERALTARTAQARRAASASARRQQTPALVGAAAAGALADHRPDDADLDGPEPGPPLAERCGRVAVSLTVLGAGLHAAAVAARGAAAGRPPLGNMYEFAVAGALAAVGAFLALLARQGDRRLGTFVLLPVTLTLGLALTVLHVEARALQPALRSSWLAIHVSTAVLCTGVFTLAAVAAALYLVRVRRDGHDGDRAPAAATARDPFPDAAALDRLAHRAVAFAFPLWTFAIIAGAIWAESAWGRYWAWDPKETWAFVTWVGYAAFLHARATAGWRPTATAWICLAGYGCFLFNFVGVNLLADGLHSYSGM